MRVLVVDDEPLVRLSLRRALERRGHMVEEAEDGNQALEKWTTSRPDLVYLDVLMPRLSGPELLKRVPEDLRADARVILMSAFSGDYNLQKARAMGADLFIAKPFDDVFAVTRAGEDLIR